MYQQIFRGIKLLVLGYILSVVGSVIPLFTAISTGCYPAGFFFHKFQNVSAFVMQINILHFAGAAIILIAILRTMNIRWKYFALIALVMSLTAPFLWGHYTRYPLLNHLIEPLWGNKVWVRYPLFAWAVYPLMGVWFGAHLQNTTNKVSFYKKITVLGVIGIVSGLVIAAVFSRLSLLDNLDSYFKRHSLEGHLCILSFVMIWISGMFFILNKLPNAVVAHLKEWSKQVTVIYVIHSIIIGWGIFIIRAHEQGFKALLLLTVFLLVLVDRLSFWYKRVRLYVAMSKSPPQ